MSNSRPIRRRQLLHLAASAAAAGAAVSCGGPNSPWRFLSAAEARTLDALCEQIVPTDQDPGAAWAGALNYIDRQLMGHFRKLQPVYREGLAAFDSASLAASGKRFADLDFAQQTKFLEKLPAPQRRFFDLVVTHTMQSYYGDPRHGGNRDGMSWKMIGVPLIPIRGRAHYDLTRKPV